MDSDDKNSKTAKRSISEIECSPGNHLTTEMNFYQFLKREGNFKRHVVVANSLSGVISIVIASTIVDSSNEIEPGKIQLTAIILFVVALIAYYLLRYYALVQISSHIESVVNETRKRISNKIQQTNLRNFENIGKEFFYTTLTTDSQIVTQSSVQIINAAGALVMVVAGSIALFLISPLVLVMALAIFSLIIFLYARIRKSTLADLQSITQKENEFFSALNDLLLGFKELKLNSKKSREFIEDGLNQVSDEVYELKAEVASKTSRTVILSQIYMYVILGAVVFIIPNLSPDNTLIVAPASALLLFITGPIMEVVSILPVWDKTNNCIQNIIRIEETLDEIGKQQQGLDRISPRRKKASNFNSIRCEAATFSYHDESNGGSFTLGPIDFELKQNEVLFIVGGNGSGKSTFLKMLTSLYNLDGGQMYLDDKPLTSTKTTTYRDLFSPIFVDFHLFEKLYGQTEIDYDRIDQLLDQMGLSDVTDIVDGKITKRDLSTGQRKRLGLVLSILEDKPIFIFDELAADQDPKFRKYFYETIIPELKADGKTILAVTHDDKYFSTADRVLKMDYGKFIPYVA